MIWAGWSSQKKSVGPCESKKVPHLNFTDREGEIILKKYSPIGELSLFAKEYAEVPLPFHRHAFLHHRHDQVVAAAGPGSKESLEN